MSAHNNLRPRHLPTWLGVTLISGFAVAATIIQLYFQLAVGWFAVAAYIILLFATIIFSCRPAWGRKAFCLGVGILFGLHVLVGLLLVLLFPMWLHTLGSFLTVIVVADLLLTMSILWRVTVAHGSKSL
jgi:hypothetical protein